MINYLSSVTVLLAVVAVFLSGPCSCSITADINENNCPEPKEDTECKREMMSSTHYIKLYSKTFNTKFLCDTRTDGGGWIVILRRVQRNTKFNQLWSLYKNGFGSVCSDYWLGLKYIHQITDSGKYEMRVDMVYQNKEYYANYRSFEVGDEASSYVLHIGGYTGNAGDRMEPHNNMKFSTPDRDNDLLSKEHCAKDYDTGWWFHKCHSTLLTGDFDRFKTYATGVNWQPLTGDYGNLDMVEMKIRPR